MTAHEKYETRGVEFFCLVCNADFRLQVGGAEAPARPGYCSTECRYAAVAQKKREAYERGAWKAPAPPVCTWAWHQLDWINYIDQHGHWDFDD